MAKKIFTLRPTADGKDGQEILTHGPDDLAERKASAKAAKRSYEVREVK